MSAGASMFASPSIEVQRRPDGALLMRSQDVLGPYPRSLGTPLRRWARERPDRVFLAERDGDRWRTVTYAEMLAYVRRLASALRAAGLDRDTPIAILSENSIAHATLALAGLYAGIPIAPISPAYSMQVGDLRRLQFILDVLQPRLVFAADADAYRDALSIVDDDAIVLVDRGTLPRGDAQRLDELIAPLADDAIDDVQGAVERDDVAKILFTSGSTGEPKGVISTHRMLCSNQQSLAQLWPFLGEHELVLVDWLPWHHTFGGSHNFNMVLYHGGSLYIDDGRPMPGRFERSVAALADVPPTLYFNVPRGHKLLADALSGDDAFSRRFFSRLRLIGNAGAALPRPTWDALRELAARHSDAEIAVTGEWGLTETSPMATAVHYPLRDPADIGLPGPGTELLFAPVEHKLEIRVRGPLVTPGYWRRDDLTASAFDDDGFYRTGDAVRFSDPTDPAQGLLFDGRIAENFKLTTGTWVDAGAVRLAVLAAAGALIDEVVVAGVNRDEIAILAFAGARARQAHPDDVALRAAVAELLAAYNATAGGSSHRIGGAMLVFEPLSPAEGEITDKGSVNQRRVLARRADLVELLYVRPAVAEVIVLGGVLA